MTKTQRIPNARELETWLVERIAAAMKCGIERVDPDGDLTNIAIDSRDAAEISFSLAGLLGRQISPTLLWDYRSIREIAEGLGEKSPKVEGPAA